MGTLASTKFASFIDPDPGLVSEVIMEEGMVVACSASIAWPDDGYATRVRSRASGG